MTTTKDKYKVLDSGHRHRFDSGALRDNEASKGRPELLSPYATMRVAVVAEKGAEKYGDRNWELGIPLSRFIQSAERHIQQAKMGQNEEDHIAHAAWNLLAYMHTQRLVELGLLDRSLSDMPDYEHATRKRFQGRTKRAREVHDQKQQASRQRQKRMLDRLSKNERTDTKQEAEAKPSRVMIALSQGMAEIEKQMLDRLYEKEELRFDTVTT